MINGAWPGWVSTILPLISAIAVFLIGWSGAAIAAGLVGRLLKQSSVDAQLARILPQRSSSTLVRQWAKRIVFWSILLMGVLFAVQVLNISAVSGSVSSLLNPILGYLPKLVSAIALVGVAWLIATVSRLLVIRSAQSLQLDETLNTQEFSHSASSRSAETTFEAMSFDANLNANLNANSDATAMQNEASAKSARRSLSLSETLGNLLYGLVFLFFVPVVLEVLELRGPLAPVQGLLGSLLLAIPLIFKAGLIGFVGWFAAQIVRSVVTNFLAAVGGDRFSVLPGQGNGPANGQMSVPEIGGTIAFSVVLIVAAIAGIEALGLSAISVPATAMLGQFFQAIPLIVTAVAIVGGAYFAGRFASNLVTSLLASVGFDGVFRVLGIEPPRSTQQKTPSQVAGMVTHLAVVLVAAIAATNILQIPALTTIVAGLTLLLGQVLIGVMIFGIGLYLANFTHGLIVSMGTPQSSLLAKTAKYAILVLVSAMALQHIGIASSIVNLAFGLLLGAIAVGLAIAFGLGGRDVAARQLQRLANRFEDGVELPGRSSHTAPGHYPPGVPANPNAPNSGYQHHDSHPFN